jgi:hypothetical protein
MQNTSAFRRGNMTVIMIIFSDREIGKEPSQEREAILFSA